MFTAFGLPVRVLQIGTDGTVICRRYADGAFRMYRPHELRWESDDDRRILREARKRYTAFELSGMEGWRH